LSVQIAPLGDFVNDLLQLKGQGQEKLTSKNKNKHKKAAYLSSGGVVVQTGRHLEPLLNQINLGFRSF
jgi:hypothetical protein